MHMYIHIYTVYSVNCLRFVGYTLSLNGQVHLLEIAGIFCWEFDEFVFMNEVRLGFLDHFVALYLDGWYIYIYIIFFWHPSAFLYLRSLPLNLETFICL